MLKLATAGRETSNSEALASHRLWSLWDIMMNFGVFGLCHLIKSLALIEDRLMTRTRALTDINGSGYAQQLRHFIDPAAGEWDKVNDLDIQQIDGLLKFTTQQADTMELQAVHDRVDIFRGKLRFPMTLQDFLAEVRTLRETLESGIRFKYFYLYPQEKALLVLKFDDKWQPMMAAFKSAIPDARAAVDCYGLGHYTACVFHCMRVLEYGLRELAAAVNLTFDIQQWQTIIEQIESQIREIGTKWSASPAKSDWTQFYSEAAKDFFFFKDGWRNYVSHNRVTYDEPMARGALDHVRSFMNHLSTRLSESS